MFIEERLNQIHWPIGKVFPRVNHMYRVIEVEVKNKNNKSNKDFYKL
jgi:hypothetical protein